jgi:hypothetical protein
MGRPFVLQKPQEQLERTILEVTKKRKVNTNNINVKAMA